MQSPNKLVIEVEIKLTLSLAGCARKAQAGHKYEFATCEIKKVTHPNANIAFNENL
jgi:hypothetical protein